MPAVRPRNVTFSMLLLLVLASPLAVGAQGAPPLGALAPARPAAGLLACAIEWQDQKPEPQALCDAIGRTLGRAVKRVDDARAFKQGDSVQVLDGDVFWTAVWLRDGEIRAFTRVSRTAAQGREVAVLARAVREISRIPPKPKGCVRLDPNGGRKMRADVIYPWVELKRCHESRIEVPDPWDDLG
jgi:hypothetical protein